MTLLEQEQNTLPEHLSSPPAVRGVHAVHVFQLHVVTFLPLLWCPLRFPFHTILGSSVTLNRMKLRDSPVCEACPNNDHIHIYMPSLDLTELSPLQFLIYDHAIILTKSVVISSIG